MSTQVTTSWGASFTITVEQDTLMRQSYIDHLARQAGLRPPRGPVEGCKGCESGDIVPHWPSTMCRSGARPHCTCDACF